MMKLPVVVGVLLLLVIAAPARAITITMDFSGTVDLSGIGGAASNTYSGSVTWDPAAVPVSTSVPDVSQYTAATQSFTFNSTDFSPFITQASIFVGNDCSLCSSPDFFDFGYNFSSMATVLNFPNTQLFSFAADLSGPTSIFSSQALPGNLDFIGLESISRSRFTTKVLGEPVVNTDGSFIATAPTASVPEPATLALTALGLLAVVLILRGRMGVI